MSSVREIFSLLRFGMVTDAAWTLAKSLSAKQVKRLETKNPACKWLSFDECINDLGLLPFKNQIRLGEFPAQNHGNFLVMFKNISETSMDLSMSNQQWALGFSLRFNDEFDVWQVDKATATRLSGRLDEKDKPLCIPCDEENKQYFAVFLNILKDTIRDALTKAPHADQALSEGLKPLIHNLEPKRITDPQVPKEMWAPPDLHC